VKSCRQAIQLFKRLLLLIIPIWLLNIYKKKNYEKKKIEIRDKGFSDLTNQEIFSIIYKNKLWNPDYEMDFNSGPGSHDPKIIQQYVDSILKYFKSLIKELRILDLGCGDFYTGSQLFKYTKNYIGIDVVNELIERNKKLYNAKNLDFYSLDIVTDELPDGDCVLLREVLQHLTNDEVSTTLNKLNKYKFVIITESIPFGKFPENLEKIKGPETRAYLNSGVVVDKPPFNFKFIYKEELLRIKRPGVGYLITNLYKN
jgi:SAM-dependent methyltransferase